MPKGLMSLELTFEPIGHTYKIGDLVIPSVTQVLKAGGVLNFSHIPQPVLQRAAARGTAVHMATQLWDEGRLDESSLDSEIGAYLEGWKAFQRDTGWINARIEQRVYHPQFGYAGTFDRTGLLGGGLVCLDIKSGIVLDGHRAQIAAYTMTQLMPRRYRRIALQLTKEGSYKVHEFPIGDLSIDFNTFLGCLNQHIANTRNHQQKGQVA